MAYISTIDPKQAEEPLAGLYRRFANPDGTVDNVLQVHSINPESLKAHCALYVQAMHRPSPVSRAEREMIGVVVSRLNGCDYCRQHHAAGLRRLLPPDRQDVADALESPAPPVSSSAPVANRRPPEGLGRDLSNRETAIVEYVTKLTTNPQAMNRNDAGALRDAGLTDREILDVAQTAAYFAYANRIVLGLGAEVEDGDRLGQWPDASPQQ